MSGHILICPRCIIPMDYSYGDRQQICRACRLDDSRIFDGVFPELFVTQEEAINLRNYRQRISKYKDFELLTSYDVQASKRGKARNHLRLAAIRDEILNRMNNGYELRNDNNYDESVFLVGVLKGWEDPEKKSARIKRIEEKYGKHKKEGG